MVGITLVGRMFADSLGDQGSIPYQVIPKTQKIVLDTSLLYTQHHKVQIKGIVEQSKERSGAFQHLGLLMSSSAKFIDFNKNVIIIIIMSFR